MHTADFWHVEENGNVQCDLCPHACVMTEGRAGRCHARDVSKGRLVARGYGAISSSGIDPVEKKPLYHFYPGRPILSIGGWGCNFACGFCQNWTISQHFDECSDHLKPVSVAARAGASGSIGVAYTYNEPLISIEYVRDCAQRVHTTGLRNVLVTNGYVNREPAASLLPHIDALNIDLKCMDDAFYGKWCGGSLAPVLDFAKQAVEAGCHVEITNLLIPGLNDSDEQVGALARWVSSELGRLTPLHLSAYRPMYKMSIPATPQGTMERAYRICTGELPYVYLGNMVTALGQDTHCPACDALLVKRRGYRTELVGLDGACCRNCRRPVDLVGVA